MHIAKTGESEIIIAYVWFKQLIGIGGASLAKNTSLYLFQSTSPNLQTKSSPEKY